MGAPAAGSLGLPTQLPGVKVVTSLSVEECCLAVENVVGHESILSASRMNNAIVILLCTVENATELVKRCIDIDGALTPVLSLSTSSKKVTISNVPLVFSDDILKQTLSH